MKKQLSFDGFEPANTTPVPDVLFDELLPYLSEAELKVLLYIIRRTSGFKKTNDAISLSQFQNGITKRNGEILDQGCGVKNRTTISNALASLEKKGCIESDKNDDPQGDKATTVYRVRFQSDGVVRKTYHGSTQNVPPVVSETYHGSTDEALQVVRKTYPQETVIQQTALQETVIQESIVVSAVAENDAPAATIHDLQKWKEESGKHKAVTLSDSQADIGNDDFADRPTEKRPAVKIGGNDDSVRNIHGDNDNHSRSSLGGSDSRDNQTAPLASQQTIPDGPPADAAQRTALPQGGAVQASSRDEKPPMALTAKQIEKQLAQRQDEILALYAQKIGRKPSRSKANLDGALKLAQDDATDEDIGTTIDAILADSFLAKNLSLTFVHSKLDALARKPIPIQQNGKAPVRDVNIGVSGLPRLPRREVKYG